MKKVEDDEKKERKTFKAKAEEAESHAKRKLEMSKMSFFKAKKTETDRLKELKDVVSKKNDAEKKKEDFERDPVSDAIRVILDEETNGEYLELDKEVGLKSAKYIQDLNEANIDQKKNEDELENLLRQDVSKIEAQGKRYHDEDTHTAILPSNFNLTCVTCIFK